MPRTGDSCDLLIVGASFAGLVAARTAAMRGLSVVVLEAKDDAGARVATTGILVKEAAEEIDVPHAMTRCIHGVRLYAPNLRHIDLFSPGSFFLTTDAARLLRWLGHEAQRAGARILFGTRFVGAARDGDRFRIGGLDLAARFVLGADGARSAVARCFGLGRNRRFLIGVGRCVHRNLADALARDARLFPSPRRQGPELRRVRGAPQGRGREGAGRAARGLGAVAT